MSLPGASREALLAGVEGSLGWGGRGGRGEASAVSGDGSSMPDTAALGDVEARRGSGRCERHRHAECPSRPDGALPWTSRKLILPAVAATAVAVFSLAAALLSFLRISFFSAPARNLVGCICAASAYTLLAGWAPVCLHRSFSYPNASATPVGLHFFAIVSGFVIGIVEAVYLAQATRKGMIALAPVLWTVGLTSTVTMFVAPPVAIYVAVRRAMSAQQNPRLEEGWVLTFVRCTWIPPLTRASCCVILPLAAVAVSVVVLMIQTWGDSTVTTAEHREHIFLWVAAADAAWWLLSSGAVLVYRQTRDMWTLFVVMLNSLFAVGWAIVGIVWLQERPSDGGSGDDEDLSVAVVAVVVVLGTVGFCTGLC
eukprot:g207.t1